MCLLQVSECTASYPESARVIGRVSLLTKYFSLFCLCLCNFSILKFCVVHRRLLLVRLNCLLQFFTPGSAKFGIRFGNTTYLIASRSQRPKLSGVLGIESEVACVHLLEVSIALSAKVDKHTNRIVFGSNLGIQLVVNTSQLIPSPSPDLFQFELQMPLLSQLLNTSCHEPWFYNTSETPTRTLRDSSRRAVDSSLRTGRVESGARVMAENWRASSSSAV